MSTPNGQGTFTAYNKNQARVRYGKYVVGSNDVQNQSEIPGDPLTEALAELWGGVNAVFGVAPLGPYQTIQQAIDAATLVGTADSLAVVEVPPKIFVEDLTARANVLLHGYTEPVNGMSTVVQGTLTAYNINNLFITSGVTFERDDGVVIDVSSEAGGISRVYLFNTIVRHPNANNTTSVIRCRVLDDTASEAGMALWGARVLCRGDVGVPGIYLDCQRVGVQAAYLETQVGTLLSQAPSSAGRILAQLDFESRLTVRHARCTGNIVVGDGSVVQSYFSELIASSGSVVNLNHANARAEIHNDSKVKGTGDDIEGTGTASLGIVESEREADPLNLEGTVTLEKEDPWIPYSPTVPGDWVAPPDDVRAALDELASRVTAGGH